MVLLTWLACTSTPPGAGPPAGGSGDTGSAPSIPTPTGDTAPEATPGEWVEIVPLGEPLVGCTENYFHRDFDLVAVGDLLVATYVTYDGDRQRLVVHAFDTTGAERWKTVWSGDDDCAAPHDLAVGPSGTIYVAGAAKVGATSAGLVLALDPAGQVLWSALEGPPAGGRFEFVEVLADETIVASGTWSDGVSQAWVAGFDAAGALAWSVQREPTPSNSAGPHGLDVTPTGDAVVATFGWNDWVAPPPEKVVLVDASGTWTDKLLLPQMTAAWGWTTSGWMVAPELEQPVLPGPQPYELRAWDTTGAVVWSRRFETDLPRHEGAYDSLVPLPGDAFVVVMDVIRSEDPPARDVGLFALDATGATSWSLERDLHPAAVEYGRAAVTGPDGAWYLLGNARTVDPASGTASDDVFLARILP